MDQVFPRDEGNFQIAANTCNLGNERESLPLLEKKKKKIRVYGRVAKNLGTFTDQVLRFWLCVAISQSTWERTKTFPWRILEERILEQRAGGGERNRERTVRCEPIDRSVNMDDTFDERADQVSTFQPKRRFRLFFLLSPLSSSRLRLPVFGICPDNTRDYSRRIASPLTLVSGKVFLHRIPCHKQIDHLSNGSTRTPARWYRASESLVSRKICNSLAYQWPNGNEEANPRKIDC